MALRAGASRGHPVVFRCRDAFGPLSAGVAPRGEREGSRVMPAGDAADRPAGPSFNTPAGQEKDVWRLRRGWPHFSGLALSAGRE